MTFAILQASSGFIYSKAIAVSIEYQRQLEQTRSEIAVEQRNCLNCSTQCN